MNDETKESTYFHVANQFFRFLSPMMQRNFPDYTNLNAIVTGMKDLTSIAVNVQNSKHRRVERLPKHRFRYQDGKDASIFVVDSKGICLEQKHEKKEEDNTSKEQCAICVSEYLVNDEIVTLPCSHEFHWQCVKPWLLQHRSCPICRFQIE